MGLPIVTLLSAGSNTFATRLIPYSKDGAEYRKCVDLSDSLRMVDLMLNTIDTACKEIEDLSPTLALSTRAMWSANSLLINDPEIDSQWQKSGQGGKGFSPHGPHRARTRQTSRGFQKRGDHPYQHNDSHRLNVGKGDAGKSGKGSKGKGKAGKGGRGSNRPTTRQQDPPQHRAPFKEPWGNKMLPRVETGRRCIVSQNGKHECQCTGMVTAIRHSLCRNCYRYASTMAEGEKMRLLDDSGRERSIVGTRGTEDPKVVGFSSARASGWGPPKTPRQVRKGGLTPRSFEAYNVDAIKPEINLGPKQCQYIAKSIAHKLRQIDVDDEYSVNAITVSPAQVPTEGMATHMPPISLQQHGGSGHRVTVNVAQAPNSSGALHTTQVSTPTACVDY